MPYAPFVRLWWMLLVCACWWSQAGFAQTLTYQRHEALDDPQHRYMRAVLDLAIAHSGVAYQARPAAVAMVQSRAIDEIRRNTGVVDLIWTVTNHVYSPWIVLVSKKYWDGLSKDEQAVLTNAAKKSRAFERQDTRTEAQQALNDLKAKGMQVNELSAAEAGRMRQKLTAVNASIAVNVGMDLWNETQAAINAARTAK